MENFSKIELNNNEMSKKELKEEKEKSRLNLRKSKLDKILFSKRMLTFINESDNDIKKNYDLNLEDIINNIPDKYKIDIPLFLDRVRNNKFLFLIQFDLSIIKEYLKSENIYFNLYGVFIVKQYLKLNNYNVDFIGALNKQIDDEFLTLITYLLKKGNKKMSFEILIILINVTYTMEGEMLFGKDQKVVENIASFIGNNKNDSTFVGLGLLLIKNMTNKNALVKQILYDYNIIEYFKEIYQKYILNSDIIENLILCLGHFINSRFSKNKYILFSINIIKSQLNHNNNFQRLTAYINILYNLAYTKNCEIIKKMIDEEIYKPLMEIFPFDEDNFSKFYDSTKNNDNNIIIDEETMKKKLQNMRILIIKIFQHLLLLEDNVYIQKLIDSGISQFINKLLKLSDIKIIKNTFNCIYLISFGTFGHVSDLYNNNTVSLALNVSKNVYEALNSKNQIINNNISKKDLLGALREISLAFSILIINSLYERIVPIIEYENGLILLLLKDTLKLIDELPNKRDSISYIFKAFYKILKSFDENIKEFLEKNGFKEVLEKLLNNSDEEISKCSSTIIDEFFDDGSNDNNNININDIIKNCNFDDNKKNDVDDDDDEDDD